MALCNADKDIIGRALQEFNASLTRVAAEKDLQKGICDRVKDATGMKPARLRKLAKIYFEQNKEEVEAEINDLLDDYDAIFPTAQD